MCKGINIPWVELQFRIYCYNVMQMYIKSYEAIILYNSIVLISSKIRKLIPLHMVWWAPYLWYFNPLHMLLSTPIHGILTHRYPWYFDPPTHGNLTPLPVVYWTPYSCYYDPPTNDIFNPLPVVYVHIPIVA
jgi:hypothetical protein